jgi:phenylpropionate dioxygenase-like ring-hydroxylating dioxygenase large terminal subunit
MRGESEYDVLTHTDPGTPGGELLRRYWQPVALAEELPVGGAPLPVRLLGEDLVLFRDEEGRPGLLGIHCAHRGADLSYGRLEDGGLRCIYHGWLYDIAGRCLEQPGEPAGSTFHERIRQTAYPCLERSSVIFAYLGPGEPPLFPNYEFLTVPEEQTFAGKLYSECNYLQGSEGNLDTIHLSFLHQNAYSDGGGPRRNEPKPLRSRGPAPHQEIMDVELTPYGYRLMKERRMGAEKYLYGGTFFPPAAYTFWGPWGDEGYSVNWHVPIDDVRHWKFTFTFSRKRTLDKAAIRATRTEMDASYHPLRNRANRYLQDRASMATETYSGIGMVFQVQDFCVTEGAGPIQDRSQEHLTSLDIGIVVARKILMKGIRDIAAGQDPPHVIRDPADNRFPRLFALSATIPVEKSWKAYWHELDRDFGETGDPTPRRESAEASARA